MFRLVSALCATVLSSFVPLGALADISENIATFAEIVRESNPYSRVEVDQNCVMTAEYGRYYMRFPVSDIELKYIEVQPDSDPHMVMLDLFFKRGITHRFGKKDGEAGRQDDYVRIQIKKRYLDEATEALTGIVESCESEGSKNGNEGERADSSEIENVRSGRNLRLLPEDAIISVAARENFSMQAAWECWGEKGKYWADCVLEPADSCVNFLRENFIGSKVENGIIIDDDYADANFRNACLIAELDWFESSIERRRKALIEALPDSAHNRGTKMVDDIFDAWEAQRTATRNYIGFREYTSGYLGLIAERKEDRQVIINIYTHGLEYLYYLQLKVPNLHR